MIDKEKKIEPSKVIDMFISLRWNKVVRNLLHKQIFTSNTSNKNKPKAPDSTHVVVNDKKMPTKVDMKVKKTIKKTANTTTFERRVTRGLARRNAEIEAVSFVTPKTVENHRRASAKISDIDDDFKQKDDAIVTRGTDHRSFWSTSQGRGLLAFIISGTFHELIIMSACRRITLENLAFFTLQGIACMIEVQLRQGALKQEPKGRTRVLCVALQLLFMALTGRLFLGPFLRYNFFI
jgi:hypothetical protein